MKKIALIAFVPEYEKGVLKKIEYQIKAFKNNNLLVENIIKKDNNYFFKEKKIGSFYTKNNLLKKICRKIEEIRYLLNLKDIELFRDIDIVYIRSIGSSPWVLNYFKFLKKNHKKIILEIPTYPYDKEKSKLNILNFLDKIYRKKLYKYVDKIVTFSEDKSIWNIPCINISNGIDLEEVKLINLEDRENSTIIFTSVSNCSFWHGIDRFLFSLKKYGELEVKKDIKFNIVGEGPRLKSYREIVSRSEYLSKVVLFEGFKNGKELDYIYDGTDIGVGSLGRHRSGLKTVRALKNREYCAKGLPMIFSEDDPDLRDVPFVYHISADEQLIDIESVIQWYENMDLKPEEIRDYSKIFSWDIQMKKAIDEIGKIYEGEKL